MQYLMYILLNLKIRMSAISTKHSNNQSFAEMFQRSSSLRNQIPRPASIRKYSAERKKIIDRFQDIKKNISKEKDEQRKKTMKKYRQNQRMKEKISKEQDEQRKKIIKKYRQNQRMKEKSLRQLKNSRLIKQGTKEKFETKKMMQKLTKMEEILRLQQKQKLKVPKQSEIVERMQRQEEVVKQRIITLLSQAEQRRT